MVPFRVLSRTNLAYSPVTPALSLRVSEICGLFNSLCALFATPVFCFQQLADSFCKTPGVAVPLRELVRCTEAQKCLFVSPLLATLTHSVSRKSFACHSYANTQDGGASAPPRHPLLRRHMRHVTPLSPVPSLDCAYFLSPRRCGARSSSSRHSSLATRHFPPAPLFSYSYKSPGGVRLRPPNQQLREVGWSNRRNWSNWRGKMGKDSIVHSGCTKPRNYQRRDLRERWSGISPAKKLSPGRFSISKSIRASCP